MTQGKTETNGRGVSGGRLQPVNYSEEKGPSYLGSCFEHAWLASPANGPQIDKLT